MIKDDYRELVYFVTFHFGPFFIFFFFKSSMYPHQKYYLFDYMLQDKNIIQTHQGHTFCGSLCIIVRGAAFRVQEIVHRIEQVFKVDDKSKNFTKGKVRYFLSFHGNMLHTCQNNCQKIKPYLCCMIFNWVVKNRLE